ncbi:hypothetical protein [Paraburkholderia saeva]|uniref:hypothetical protein n=1 Tax=Paraburkholderia saeva TaxID=2777537 RepID=UPI001DD5E555|nr:hypothetical protein [Paraburkholderia saeva]CAG4919842.1 hypothetical protein R70241_04788 [Paraburkholderia saeva]
MDEQQEHRGFTITVSTRDDRAGGAFVTLLIERTSSAGHDTHSGVPHSEPEHYRSVRAGPAAVGEAMDRARRAIDEALGEPDPLGD